MRVASHGDPETSSVVALTSGDGSRTIIILAGHFDIVSTAHYGVLASLACNPESLTGALMEELESRARIVSKDKTLADLKSGFVPGRGLLDMKSGLAAGIAAMECFAGLETPVGDILFIVTPDEENGSPGICRARVSA